MERGEYEFDLLISHRESDSDAAEQLQQVLEGRSRPDGRALRVWIDKVDIEAGESHVRAINSGLERSRHVALFMTPEYFSSPSGWTDAEWHAALNEDPDGRRGRVLPLLAKDCPALPPLLAHLSWIDLRGSGFDRGVDEIVDRVSGQTKRARRDAQGVTRFQRATDRLVNAGTDVESLPETIGETLVSNLLPIKSLPASIWRAPLRLELASTRGTITGFPRDRELRDILREKMRASGHRRGWPPVFVRSSNDLICFSDLDNNPGYMGSLVDARRSRRMSIEDALSDGQGARELSWLINEAVRLQMHRQGLSYDRKGKRYFYEANGSDERRVKWRSRHGGREVVKCYRNRDGDVVRWRHRAVKIEVVSIGPSLFLRVIPTLMFSSDGSWNGVWSDSRVGPLATKVQSREFNWQVRYLIHFWASVLGKGKTPIAVPLGQSMMLVSPDPLEVELPRGISGDAKAFVPELDDADEASGEAAGE